MTLEREVLISALKMTKEGGAQIEDISLDAEVPARIVYRIMRRNSESEIVRLNERTVIMDREQRLRAATRIIELGADIERVCKLLQWNEFEDVSAVAFESAGFSVKKHFRFKHLDRWWEIDILALANSIAASVDCKHWHRGWRRSSITKIVEDQINRTKALAEASPLLLERMGMLKWNVARFVPIVLSLIPSDLKFCEHTPVVPILQLRDFLSEMPARVDSLVHFSKKVFRVDSLRH